MPANYEVDFNVRIKPGLRKALRERAKTEGCNIKVLAARYLSQGLAVDRGTLILVDGTNGSLK